jgi:DNA repair protein RecO (recombination protein O)
LKLFVKGSKKKSLIQQPFVTPLARGEYVYTSPQRGLGKLHEATMLSYPRGLRESLACLEVGAQMSQALLRSQWEGKSAARIYLLFSYFLERLWEATTTDTIGATFLLKILSHEGILEEEAQCSLCKTPLQEPYRWKGECFCKKDAPAEAVFFTKLEEEKLNHLTHSRLFTEIASYPLEKKLLMKIEQLFAQSMEM